MKRVKKLHDADEDLLWKLTEAAAGQVVNAAAMRGSIDMISTEHLQGPNSIDLCALHVFGGQKDSFVPVSWPGLDFTTSDLNWLTIAPT